MKKLSIATKLSITFLIVLSMGLLSSFYSENKLKEALGFTTELYMGPYAGVAQIVKIQSDVNSIDKQIDGLNNKTYSTEDDNIILSKFSEINDELNAIINSGLDDISLVEELEQALSNLKIAYEEIRGHAEQNNNELVKKLTNKDSNYKNMYTLCIEKLNHLYDFLNNRGEILYNEILTSQNNSINNSIVLIIVGVIVSILSCIYILNSIRKPKSQLLGEIEKISGEYGISIISESNDELEVVLESVTELSDKMELVISDISRILSEVAQGNFNVATEEEYSGKFKEIEGSIIKITHSLSEAMSEINIASEEVDIATNQISEGAHILAQGATEQASAIQELLATVSEIEKNISINTRNAKEAKELSLRSTEEVKSGNVNMAQMIEAMNKISLASNEIGKIIKTIDDIAFQTNVLSLNAEVEAARAGVAGKGFAVVAEEVRNLAAKSAQAAKHTSELIEGTIGAVNNGSDIVENTAKSLNNIVELTNNSTTLINNISKSSEEQAQAIYQLMIGTQQISEVIQTNTATAEESAAGSEELSGQANMLKSLVGKFEFKNNYG